MNDLSLFNSNQSKETFEAGSKVKNTTSKEVVTTKQLADILGVDVRTVQMTAKRILDPAKVLSRVINGGKSMIFDEKQAMFIKQEIQKHHNLMTTKDIAKALNISDRWVRNTIEKLRNNNSAVFEDICLNSQGGFLLNETQVTAIKLELQNHSKVNALSPKTLLEKQLLIQQAMQLQSEMIEELQAENERQKAQLTEQAPKVEMYNKLVDRSFCKCLRDTAQFIGEHEKHFLQVLQDKKVIYKHAGHYRAYADYADCFELKVYTYGENKTGQQLLVNIKGLELVKKIFKEV